MTADSELSFKSARMMERAEELAMSGAFKSESVAESEGLVLLDNVQFIYELALAELELEALGAKFEITNGLRKFKLLEVSNPEKLKRRLAYFRSVNGDDTDYFRIVRYNQTRSVNQYLTHWIYPYKGKFHPQMIRALLNYIGVESGDNVLDPFIGSGTTALEAQLLGVNCIGIDVSPLCVLQSRIKTESVDVLPEIQSVKESISLTATSPLLGSGDQLDKEIESLTNEKVRNFFSMAKMVALSDNDRRGRNFHTAFAENLGLMTKSVSDYVDARRKLNLALGHVDIRQGDSRALPLRDGEIDGIITSPPYSIALDYVANDAHALEEMGHNLEKIRGGFIGVGGTGRTRIDLYDADMRRSFAEMYRVLGEGRFAAIVIGNASYMGNEVQTVDFTTKECEKLGFKLVKNIDKIIFGLYNVMRKENILVFQKPS